MDLPYKKAGFSDGILIKTALISVYDKSGILELACELNSRGIKIISTGGTCQLLKKEHIPVVNISEITKFPEIMGGRVKTLHPKIYGSLLGVQSDPEHVMAMREHELEPIDLVVVNLYPFEEVFRRGDDYQAIIENIDIGGPSMIRAAAKNHAYVTVLTNPEDYSQCLSEMDSHDGKTLLEFRKKMAGQAFSMTAAYDKMICDWFTNTSKEDFPEQLNIKGTIQQKMRYGENPHQRAALYVSEESRAGVTNATLLQGKQLSYNNIADLDAAYELVAEFHPDDCAACVIVKHANPCGVAIAKTPVEAYRRALACDPVSAFGGVVAFNKALDQATAREVIKNFTEAVIAPGISKESEIVISEKPNMRFLKASGLPDPLFPGVSLKTVAGGLLLQTRDNVMVDSQEFKIMTKRHPSPQELEDMKFSLKIVKHVKSNAIVYGREGRTIGIGAGQMSRVDSACFAIKKAEEIAMRLGVESPMRGSVVASEAFYPFPDGVLVAIKAGVTAIIQPGGSIRDSEVISVADQHNIAMIFTGIRHFRH
ncbi:bifunctional phosphoribosylaminoimidazolecarboxamide formyltransferase/IMP cyclohydrolase [Candidatus Liberibacter sp.]|uniref:bifunctional phosphoribosylaminoimidazolecarboxamide formyltransferase/IMP cyclohydrolase n=1 Tax=Candidatus Liberibacter sp. TaxID=34022 RepID=UPI0015F70C7D|nr:bifunctional phosphoribosylaminoimidazolecarboxamide formyltransferase/IMP cyclohydrolase [Candidatus Liberibacter sp.]MBA5723639.1 bifunctional phosphoribosylaminoimidazolecarboxamide formyltransferase/IMP cyclohydrolase [Candidatus Liberibacter sp.]